MKKNDNCIFSKKRISKNNKEKNISLDKWDYESIETKNRLLENKLKKTELIIEHLNNRKPCILFRKKRKKWNTKMKNLIMEKEEIINELYQTHIEIEDLLPDKKEEDTH